MSNLKSSSSELVIMYLFTSLELFYLDMELTMFSRIDLAPDLGGALSVFS